MARIGADLLGQVRVVVVQGAGRAFSAGLDRSAFVPSNPGDPPGVLETLVALPPDEAEQRIAGYQAGFGWLADPALVSVAAVQGHAIGAGFQLALACDLRVATTDAQFTMAEPALGLVPDLGGTKRLVELVGYSRAAEICLTGRRITADVAERIGLVSEVVAPDQLGPAVARIADAVRALPSGAVRATKKLLLAAADRSQDEQEQAERSAQYQQLRRLRAARTVPSSGKVTPDG